MSGGGVLLLSNNRNSWELYNWLCRQEEAVHFYSEKLNPKQLSRMNPFYIVSYNYRYIIPAKVIQRFNGKICNLHISYLPWNKGASPNFWSFVENTPKGVTIHEVDAGLDTGNILVQKEIEFDEERESFASSYERLNREILQLFQENWQFIKARRLPGKRQMEGSGSYHDSSDMKRFMKGTLINWQENIKSFKEAAGVNQ